MPVNNMPIPIHEYVNPERYQVTPAEPDECPNDYELAVEYFLNSFDSDIIALTGIPKLQRMRAEDLAEEYLQSLLHPVDLHTKKDSEHTVYVSSTEPLITYWYRTGNEDKVDEALKTNLLVHSKLLRESIAKLNSRELLSLAPLIARVALVEEIDDISVLDFFYDKLPEPLVNQAERLIKESTPTPVDLKLVS